jgi:hypothetical protein
VRREADRDSDSDKFRDEDRRPPVRTSGKAVASLVLGVLSFCLSALAGIPAVILGVLGLNDISRSPRRVGGRGVAIAGIVTGALGTLLTVVLIPVIGLLLPAVQKVRDAAARVETQKSLKAIAVGLHNYHNAKGHLPPPYLRTPDGRPGLSWRVDVLPYVEQPGLYRQFKLDEPWDSPANRRLLDQMPAVFRAFDAAPGETRTYFRVFVGAGALFEPGRQLRFADISDGSNNTLMVVEAAEAVPWTAPEELEYDPTRPLPRLGHVSANQFQAAFADGSVRPVRADKGEAAVRGMITRAGGEPVLPD